MHVHGTRPRTWAVNTAVSIGSTRPFTGRVLYTGRKHGRVQGTRPFTRPCSGHGRTMHGRVHGTYTAVHTGRKEGRVDGRVHGTRPVHGHVYGTYTVGYGPEGVATGEWRWGRGAVGRGCGQAEGASVEAPKAPRV